MIAIIIQSKNVWNQDKFSPLQIRVEGGRIAEILKYDETKCTEDFHDAMIIPGLVDVHTHGYMGVDCNHASREWLEKWVRYLPSEGVTSVVPSTTSCPEELLLGSLAVIAEAIEHPTPGAEILGVNIEGPFISQKYRGAQNPNNIVKPAVETLQKYISAAKGNVLYCLIAPEEDEGLETTKFALSQGIKVAIGHSGASVELCAEAKKLGVSSFTHTFNGMPGLHHRNLGPAGAAMYFEDMYAEVVGDGIHVDFKVVRLLGKLKGPDKLILITDSAAVKGFEPGHYNVAGREVLLGADGSCRLPDGSIASSVGKMNEFLGNLINHAGLDKVTAINAATSNPASMLGLGDKKGSIKVGYDADMVVLSNDYSVCQTFVKGQKML